MPARAEINTKTVISALYQLRFDHRGESVTIEAIARHLEVDAETVRKLLLALRRSRIVRDRRRAGERVWEPWAGQR